MTLTTSYAQVCHVPLQLPIPRNLIVLLHVLLLQLLVVCSGAAAGKCACSQHQPASTKYIRVLLAVAQPSVLLSAIATAILYHAAGASLWDI